MNKVFHNYKAFNISLAFFIFFLLQMIAGRINIWLNYNRLVETGGKAKGRVSDIVSETTGSGSNRRTVERALITFITLDSTEITVRVSRSSNMDIGGSVELYYNPANPQHFTLYPRSFTGALFSVFSIGVLAAIIFVFVRFLISSKYYYLKKRRDSLVAGGHYVMAEVNEVKEERSGGNRGVYKYLYIVHARYQENDEFYEFKSHKLWFNTMPCPPKIRVYVDRDDYSNYYVYADSLLKKDSIFEKIFSKLKKK